MLFQKRFHAGLLDGSVTVTFRQWASSHVKVGGRYRVHPLGVLEIDRVEKVRLRDVSEEDVRRSGFESRDDMLEYLRGRGGDQVTGDLGLYRIEFHHGGEEDRVPLALEAKLTPEQVEDIARRLDRLDARSPIGPWTRKTLRLIARYPRVAAAKLAARVERERDDFKVDVRKLKRLGLTQSLEVGYLLSPRGEAFLAAPRKRRSRAPSRKG